MNRTFRSRMAALAGVAALGVTLGISSEARADVGIESHVDIDLTADAGGLFYMATPSVKIVDPRRLTVSISDAPGIVHSRIVGMRYLEVNNNWRPIMYVGRHRYVQPVVYFVPRPIWIMAPQAIYIAPPPRRPYYVIQRERRPDILVIERDRRPIVVEHRYQPKKIYVNHPSVVVQRPGVVVHAPHVAVRPNVVVAQPHVAVRPPAVVVRPQPAARPPPPAARPQPPAARPPPPAARPAPPPPRPPPAARPAPAPRPPPAARPAPARRR